MTTEREMPCYKCHKEVHALRIKSIDPPRDPFGGCTLHFEDGYAPIAMSPDWTKRHGPKEGGYLVVYADGYRSFSPAEAFEEGYTRIDAPADPAEETT